MVDDGGNGPRVTIRPTGIAWLQPLGMAFLGVMNLTNSHTGLWHLVSQVVGVLFLVFGISLAIATWFGFVRADQDGITRRWFRTSRWRWDQLAGIDRTSRGTWIRLPDGGDAHRVPLPPWISSLGRRARGRERGFHDAVERLAGAQGVTVRQTPPAPHASPAARVATYLGLYPERPGRR
jgi:hypothetical protein